MANVATLLIKILADNKGAKKALGETATAAQKVQSGFGKAAVPAGIALGVIVAGAAKAGKAASDLEQSSGAVESVYKGNADAVKAYGKQAAVSNGLATSEYQQMAAVIGAQLKSLGRPTADLAKETDGLIDVASDLAATFGGETSDAVTAVSALLRGERDPIERYGVALKQTDVDARKAADGIVTAEAAAKAAGKANGVLAKAQDALLKARKTGTPAEVKAAAAAVKVAEKSKAAADAVAAQENPTKKQADAAATLALLMEQTADAQGQFAREADTAAGAQARSNAKIEDATAAVGTALLPVMSKLADVFATVATLISDNTQAFQIIIGVVAAVAAGILVVNAAMTVFRTITTLATAAQWLMNAALLANPIGLIVLAIAALVAGFILLWTQSETFRKVVIAVFEKVRATIAAVVEWAVGVFATLVDIFEEPFQALLGVVRSVFGLIKSVIGLAIRFITGLFAGFMKVIGPILDPLLKVLTGPFEKAKAIIAGVFKALEKIVRDVIGAITGFLKGLSDKISGIASAIDKVNPFTAPPPAAMARAVAGPWSRSSRSSRGGGGSTTINVYTTGDSLEAEAAVVRALRRQARLNGGVVPALGWTS